MKPADDVTNTTKLDNNVIDDDDDDVRFKDDTAALLHVISRVRKAYITPPNGGVCANFEASHLMKRFSSVDDSHVTQSLVCSQRPQSLLSSSHCLPAVRQQIDSQASNGTSLTEVEIGSHASNVTSVTEAEIGGHVSNSTSLTEVDTSDRKDISSDCGQPNDIEQSHRTIKQIPQFDVMSSNIKSIPKFDVMSSNIKQIPQFDVMSSKIQSIPQFEVMSSNIKSILQFDAMSSKFLVSGRYVIDNGGPDRNSVIAGHTRSRPSSGHLRDRSVSLPPFLRPIEEEIFTDGLHSPSGQVEIEQNSEKEGWENREEVMDVWNRVDRTSEQSTKDYFLPSTAGSKRAIRSYLHFENNLSSASSAGSWNTELGFSSHDDWQPSDVSPTLALRDPLSMTSASKNTCPMTSDHQMTSFKSPFSLSTSSSDLKQVTSRTCFKTSSTSDKMLTMDNEVTDNETIWRRPSIDWFATDRPSSAKHLSERLSDRLPDRLSDRKSDESNRLYRLTGDTFTDNNKSITVTNNFDMSISNVKSNISIDENVTIATKLRDVVVDGVSDVNSRVMPSRVEIEFQIPAEVLPITREFPKTNEIVKVYVEPRIYSLKSKMNSKSIRGAECIKEKYEEEWARDAHAHIELPLQVDHTRWLDTHRMFCLCLASSSTFMACLTSASPSSIVVLVAAVAMASFFVRR